MKRRAHEVDVRSIAHGVAVMILALFIANVTVAVVLGRYDIISGVLVSLAIVIVVFFLVLGKA